MVYDICGYARIYTSDCSHQSVCFYFFWLARGFHPCACASVVSLERAIRFYSSPGCSWHLMREEKWHGQLIVYLL